ncbi:MAG: SDR family NAD(P)-dependent oxidoreductase [Polaromonas sp.]
MTASIRGLRFVITGGASGIGLAVARQAIARGATVCLLDRDAQGLQIATQDLGGVAHGVLCDVADPQAVASAIETTAALMGGINAVVNSAGVDLHAPLEQVTDEDWSRLLAVNLTGPMLVCRAAVPHLRRAGGGTIVNLSSAAGLMPLMNRAGYCATKAGVVMFGKALAMELAADEIRVNAVCPGAVDTPLFRKSYEESADPEDALESIRQRYALRRVATPDELAEVVLFLSSPASSYVTGIALAVDGGRSFH